MTASSPLSDAALDGQSRPTVVPERTRSALICAYPTISGMTREFFEWHATPAEKDAAWRRVTEARHLRAVLDATYPNGWTS